MPGLKDNYMIAVGEAIELGLGQSKRVVNLDKDSEVRRLTILVDKRYYDIRLVNDTESGVEIDIDRRVIHGR